MPSLVSGRRFSFRRDLVARFSHATSGHWPLSPQLVLFVRDPRDALFSAWRRAQKSHADTAPFVDWVQQIDHAWHVRRAAAYLLHLATWKHYVELLNTPYLVVRFEDVKTSARSEFRRLQNFLPGRFEGLVEFQIDGAVHRSTFEAVKSVEDQMLFDGTFAQRINHAGVPYEYRSHFDASMHDAVGAGGAAIYRWLRYDAPAEMISRATPSPHPDLVNLLGPVRGPVASRALNEAIAFYSDG